MTVPTASLTQVKAFLGLPGKPLSTSEFKEFWEPLPEEEKLAFKQQVAEAIEEMKKS